MPAVLGHFLVFRETALALIDEYGEEAAKVLRVEPKYERKMDPKTDDSKMFPSPYRGKSDGGLTKYGYIGSCGPDICYMHNRIMHKGESRWADLTHYHNSGRFVAYLVDLAKTHKDSDLGLRIMAFTIGYITHIMADAIVHPYVNTFAGAYHHQVASKEAHQTIEVNMDSWMAKHYYGLKDITTTGISHSWSDYVDDSNWIGKASDRAKEFFKEINEVFMSTYGEYPDGKNAADGLEYLLVSYYNFWSFVLDIGYDTALGPVPTNPNPGMVTRFRQENYPSYLFKAKKAAVEACIKALDYWSGKAGRDDLLEYMGNWNLDTGYRIKVSSEGGQLCIKYEHSWAVYDVP
ncbi:zinc dependent phospholipase C family protein [Methanooceanicella nereidis]|nr:zinc dependent phospholipase C family protein [Methanocella sp. CWC-04]